MDVLRHRRGGGSLFGLVRGRADLEAEGLELLREIGHFLVTEVELEGKGLQLGRLHVAALLRVLHDGAALQGVE